MVLRVIKFIVVIGIVVAAWALWQLYTPASVSGEEVVFTIESGSGVNQISRELHDAGLIKSKLVFETYVWAIGAESDIIAGRYEMNSGWNIPQVTDVIMGGSDDEESRLTIIEGWNRTEIAEYLDTKGYDGEAFIAVTARAADWVEDFPFLADVPSGASLEGFLYPDTYNVNEYTTEETFVRRLLKNFERRVDTSMPDLFETVTLASIVELEVHLPEHRRTVAGIFQNRLDADMGLQSDATINFITNKGHRRPLLEDLEIDSPYNTYKYRGLPPGPISNPSVSAIEAAANPEQHDYLYFLNNQAGDIFYARTFEEHQKNRELYLD